MAEAFDVPGTANQRLNRTVILYDKKPFLALATDADPGQPETFKLHKANSNRHTHCVPYTDPLFSLQFPKLGYSNIMKDGRTSCWFLSRSPVRRTRHGLCEETLKIGLGPEMDAERPRSQFFIYTKPLEDTINGVYPTQEAAFVDTIEGDSYGRAFHRDFAFIKTAEDFYGLYYKETLIGIVNRDRSITMMGSGAASFLVRLYEKEKFPFPLKGV